MRPVALIAMLTLACGVEQPKHHAVASKPAAAQTQTVAPPAVPKEPDNTVPVNVTNCAENQVSFIGVEPNTMQITGADGQTIEESTEVRSSDYRKEAFMIGLDLDKSYVVEARLIGNVGRVERIVRCGTQGEMLRAETAELKTGAAIAPLVRIAVNGDGPSKVAYRDKDGAMKDVPLQVTAGGTGADLAGPIIHLTPIRNGKLVAMTITAEDPSGIESIRYIFSGVQQEMQPYTEPVKFDPRLWSKGYVIAADKAGNRTQVQFTF